LCILSGCNTPSQRIKQHRDTFETLDSDVQQNVRRGRVEIGYSKEAVRIALGEADRTYRRTTSEAQAEVWSYVRTEYRTTRRKVRGEFRVRDRFRNQMRSVTDDVWVDVQNEIQYEVLRVEFVDGLVSAVEHVTP